MARRLTIPATSAESWTEAADAVSLPRLDEVGGLVRPSNIGVSYSEREYAALAHEQELSWSAEGEQQARALLVRARGLEGSATAAQVLLSVHEGEVRQAWADYQHAARVLLSYTRREPGAKLRYWLGWLVLVLGDMAGVWSAAVIHGDIVFIALGQALASGTAAGCAGLVGLEVKYLRMARARHRDPDSLSEDERRYVRLFSGGTDAGLRMAGLVGAVSLVVVVLLGLGIFTLRGSVEGSAAGVTFGLLAAATALGSFLLGYSAGDEVADLLAAMQKRAYRVERRYLNLAASKVITRQARADAAAQSMLVEFVLRGQAAARRVESLSWRIQRNNPQVFGHGFPAIDPVVGRRDRQRCGCSGGDER